MPKTTYGACNFCGDGDPNLDAPSLVKGQHVYIYVDGKIKQAGFACSHCLVHHGLR